LTGQEKVDSREQQGGRSSREKDNWGRRSQRKKKNKNMRHKKKSIGGKLGTLGREVNSWGLWDWGGGNVPIMEAGEEGGLIRKHKKETPGEKKKKEPARGYVPPQPKWEQQPKGEEEKERFVLDVPWKVGQTGGE